MEFHFRNVIRSVYKFFIYKGKIQDPRYVIEVDLVEREIDIIRTIFLM